MDRVILNGTVVPLRSRAGRAFLADFTRAMEKTIPVAELRMKHGVSADSLRDLMANQSFIDALANERSRRAGNGTAASSPSSASSAKRARKKPGAPAKRLDAKAGKSLPAATSFADDSELVEDLARFADGILSEKEVRKRHRLDEKAWLAMAEDELLCERIDDRKIRRVRDGSTKRELAQLHIVRGPQVLANIMDDPSAHWRGKVDAIKTLDHLATPPGQAGAADASRFAISIDLTADGGNTIEHYNKPIKIGVSDDTDNIDTIAILAAKNKSGSGNDGGQHI
jgi:hypothetical protein